MHVGGGRRDWRLPGESTREDWVVTWREVSAWPRVLCKSWGSRASHRQCQDAPTVGPWERELAAEAFTHGKTQEMGSLGS